MIKILQFGEGNFLRSFVDAYFNALNLEKQDGYEVTIIKPIPFGSLEKFHIQNNAYHLILRGYEKNKTVEDFYKISCVKRVIDPFLNFNEYVKTAIEPELKIIISNTTEAGICFNKNDNINNLFFRREK